MKVLLTGGCGFIGSAVVRHLLRHTDHIVVNVDKLTYAASEDALEEARDHTRHVLVRADIADAAAMRAGVRRPPARRGDAPGGRKPRRPLDRRPGRLRPDQRRRHLHPAGGGARSTTPRCRRRGAAAFRFHHISTDEVFGALGAGRSAVHRDHAVRSAQPLFRQQGRVRPSGPRLAPHLRAADHRQQHLQQLRPLAVPGETDPAGHAERAGGQGAAGLRRRLQPCATGCSSRITPPRWCACWSTGSPAHTYAIGARQPRSNLRGGAGDLRRIWTPRCPIRPGRASG